MPVVTSQVRVVLSAAAVSRRLPSGKKAAVEARYSCPSSKSCSILPVAKSHILAVRSRLAVTIRLPSREECGGEDGVGVPLQHAALQHANFFVAGDAPELDAVVVAAGEDRMAVGRKHGAIDPAAMPAQRF